MVPTLKSVLLLLTTLAASTTMFVCGVAVAAYVISDPEPHRFTNMETPDLWTTNPVSVDPAQQDYERLDPVASLASLPAVDTSREARGKMGTPPSDPASTIDRVSTGAISRDEPPLSASLDPAHADWCFARYRSYRVEDDSYQPYGGGPRQQCKSPWTPMEQDAQLSGGAPADLASAPGEPHPVPRGNDNMREYATDHAEGSSAEMRPNAGAHEQWCYARYRSYRVEDNSYKPFDGRDRRTCQSPYG